MSSIHGVSYEFDTIDGKFTSDPYGYIIDDDFEEEEEEGWHSISPVNRVLILVGIGVVVILLIGMVGGVGYVVISQITKNIAEATVLSDDSAL